MLRRGKERAQVRLLDDDYSDRLAVEAAKLDPRRFEALYRKYVAQIYTFALYELRDQHAAEDLTSQVFLRALSGLPAFREQADPPDSSFRVWLFQIARHVASNERRRGRRHPHAPLELAETVASADDIASTVATRDELSRVWQAIDRLPDDRRQALLLRFVEEMSTPEIGAVMGRSDGAVRVLIHRGVRTVAGHLLRKRE